VLDVCRRQLDDCHSIIADLESIAVTLQKTVLFESRKYASGGPIEGIVA
jgi:hypothetical protein